MYRAERRHGAIDQVVFVDTEARTAGFPGLMNAFLGWRAEEGEARGKGTREDNEGAPTSPEPRPDSGTTDFPRLLHAMQSFDRTAVVCFENVTVAGIGDSFSFDSAPALELLGYRNRVLEAVGLGETKKLSTADSPTMVIVSRNSTTRRFVNEEQVRAVLQARFQRFDVRLVELEKLSVQDQLELISRTTVLIGAHSGALLHALWMPSAGAVVQLHPYHTHFGTNEYAAHSEPMPFILNVERFTERIGRRYAEVVSTDDSLSKHCTTAREIRRTQKLNGGTDYKCYFYSDFLVDPVRVVEAVVASGVAMPSLSVTD